MKSFSERLKKSTRSDNDKKKEALDKAKKYLEDLTGINNDCNVEYSLMVYKKDGHYQISKAIAGIVNKKASEFFGQCIGSSVDDSKLTNDMLGLFTPSERA